MAHKLLNKPRRVTALVFLVKNNIQKVNPFFEVFDQAFLSKDQTVEANLLASLYSDSPPIDVAFFEQVMKKTVKEVIEAFARPLFESPPHSYLDMMEASLRAAEEARKTTSFCADVPNVLPELSNSLAPPQASSDSYLRFEDLLEADLQGPGLQPRLLTTLPTELPLGEEEVDCC